MMSLSGIPIRVVGIDLCVRSSYRSHGIGSEPNRDEVFALQSNSDFIILFADDDRMPNMDINAPITCRWLRINEHATWVALEPVDDA